MEKYIYKITNKINGKAYIGQTTNYKRRFYEHKITDYKNSNNQLYKDMYDYGIENFTFEVIENKTPNYNERERYWIKYYHTYIYDSEANGYNMTKGGEEPPVNKKENSPFATHTQEEVDIVINYLLNTKISIKEIAKITDYDHTTIERINYGKLWHDEKLAYPLRKETSTEYRKERAKNIIDDLLYSKLTQKEIAEKYKCARSTITAINIGQNHKQDDLSYPLRKEAQNRHSKTIMMYDTEGNFIKEFISIIEAAEFLGNKNKKSSIKACLSGRTNTAYGYIWKYK